MRSLLSPAPLWQGPGLALLRILLGLLLIYHGKEIFQPDVMKSYLDWDSFKGPNALIWVYVGKTSEFVAGLSLALGLGTRLGALLCVGTLTYVTWVIGEGRFWYEDQHPFMFVMMGLVYVFAGPVQWSLDQLIWKKA
jgi:putative oxidoreductase